MNLWVPGRKGGKRDTLGVWDLYTTILKIDKQEVPTV